MAVDTEPLIARLVAAVNPPAPAGSTSLFADVSDADAWRLVLANAFWGAHLKGYFTDYRLNTDGDSILTVVGSDDMPDGLQQLIVLFAAREVVRGRLLSLPTVFKVRSGEEEFETQQSATVLKALLDSLDKELEAIREDLLSDARAATSVGLIDLVLERGDPYSTWVGA